MLKVNNVVKVKNADVEVKDELLSNEAVVILKGCNFTGLITQIKEDLIYVTFSYNGDLLTQIYKTDDLEVVK